MSANKLTEKQIDEIINLYKKDTPIRKLSNDFGVSYQNIRVLLLRRNLLKVNPKHSRLHNPNLKTDVFNNIDTEFKAYLLGLICADGHVSSNHQVELTLQARDKQLLEKVKVGLNHYTPLIKKEGKGNRQDAYRLMLCSKEMCADLRKIGLNNNKTENLSINILEVVPDNLLRHFVRGFFDGDGCITETKNDYELGVIGCEAFIKPLKNILEDVLDIHFSISKHTTSYIRTIRVSGRYQCIKFGEWMYVGATIYMQRKYDKYLELVSSELENPGGKLALKDYDIICKLYKTGKHTYNDLASLYNINKSHVARIVKGYKPNIINRSNFND